MEGAVPGRVTEIPATTQANCVASIKSIPSASAVARPPLKASPAPVVSTIGPASTAGVWRGKGGGFVKGAPPPRGGGQMVPPAAGEGGADPLVCGQRPDPDIS